METRDRIIIILVFLITLVLIAGGYFVYFYQNRIDRSAELLKQKEQNQAIRNGCLKENEFTSDCYSIKLSADKQTIIDVFRVNYAWCWTDTEIEENSFVFWVISIPLLVVLFFIILKIIGGKKKRK